MTKQLKQLKIKFDRLKKIRLKRQARRAKRFGRNPYVKVPALTFSALLVLSVIAYLLVNHYDHPVNNAYVVIVSHDHQVQTVPSREPTVGTLLAKLNIKINPGDVVEPNLATRINQDKFRINVYRARPVEIVDGSQRTFTFSAATTPRAIADQAGVKTYAEDQLTMSPVDNFLYQGAVGKIINVKQSVPISLILYGTPVITRSHSDTIAEMLKEKHIVLQKGDTVQPAENTPITANEQILILHAGTQITTATQPIAEPVQIINDATLTVGTSATRQQGSPGVLLITYFVDATTGVKTQLQSVQLQPPIPEIIAKGTAPKPETSSLSSWLSALRGCESGGNYADDTGNGYYGAYQFSEGTWERLGLSGLPSSAAPSVQDQAIVTNTNKSSGGLASQNPGCYYKTGISAFPPD